MAAKCVVLWCCTKKVCPFRLFVLILLAIAAVVFFAGALRLLWICLWFSCRGPMALRQGRAKRPV